MQTAVEDGRVQVQGRALAEAFMKVVRVALLTAKGTIVVALAVVAPAQPAV